MLEPVRNCTIHGEVLNIQIIDFETYSFDL